MTRRLDYQNSVIEAYPEVYTSAALEALDVLAPLNRDRRELMARRIARRLARERGRQRIAFLDPQALIPRTSIRVQDARDGNFEGSEIPADLKRQWIQGTGPSPREMGPDLQYCNLGTTRFLGPQIEIGLRR